MASQRNTESNEALRDRLKMLEVEHRGVFESTQTQLKTNKDIVTQLRHENKELRASLCSAKKSTGSFLEREAHVLDSQIFKTQLRLDEARAEVGQLKLIVECEKEVGSEIEQECQPIHTPESFVTRKIRMLENRLDKSLVKYNEAVTIRRTYEQIVKRLREERVGFDNQLAAIERTLKAKDHDYQELLKMSHEANHAKELAKKQLQDFRTAFEQERKAKDQQLTRRKEYIQERVDLTRKLEKREELLRQQEANLARLRLEEENSKSSVSQRERSDRGIEDEGRLNMYEAAFQRIKEATGITAVGEIEKKYNLQVETKRNLEAMKKESEERIVQLRLEKGELMAKLEELKYSGSGQLGSRRIVEEFEVHLREAANHTKQLTAKLDSLSSLLIHVKAGVHHLQFVISSSSPGSDSNLTVITDENVALMLAMCKDRVAKLAEQVVVPTSDAVEDQLIAAQIDLGPNNRRVPLSKEAEEEQYGQDDDNEAKEDQGDDAVLKRDQIKKISDKSLEREQNKRGKSKR